MAALTAMLSRAGRTASVSTPPRLFAAISLLMIIAMVVGTGLIQAPFFRQTIIDREAALVRDMVNALALANGISAADMQIYAGPEAQKRFDQSFSSLKKLPDEERIKVFNRDNTIVWSDDESLIGLTRTTRGERLALAMEGKVQAVFNPVRSEANLEGAVAPNSEMIECYVPIYMQEADKPSTVIGVLSIYRDPHELNRTIRQGLYLLWTIIGAAGLVLFVALYTLFKLVYSRQKSAESKFSKLTVEHERIVQIEKMSAMGELVANIAHQLNNPLVGVINLTQLAERQLKDPNRVSELLAEVRKAGAECRDIVHRILRISQISRSTLQPTDVKELVQDTITFCHQSIDRNQALEFAAPEGKVMLDVDPVLIRQALFNLIHNAILAAPGKQVRVTLAAAEHERVTGVQLSVVDSGNGFGSDVAAKLFKPFFTTRSNGTGLGLSVAQHIAMKHGGVVLAENLPSGGARFSIWLPATTVV
jgi:signal transduction histidine kinase